MGWERRAILLRGVLEGILLEPNGASGDLVGSDFSFSSIDFSAVFSLSGVS